MKKSHSNLETTSLRAAALMQARDLVDGDRNRAHGDPTENMTRFAELLRAYLGNRPAGSIEAVDAAPGPQKSDLNEALKGGGAETEPEKPEDPPAENKTSAKQDRDWETEAR